MKPIRYSLFYTLATLTLLLCGCNQEDDIQEIFVSGPWTLVNYYTNVEWGSNNDRYARPVYTQPGDLEVINQFIITFNEDGTLLGQIDNQSISGKWQANAEDRSVSIKINESGFSGKNKEFVQSLEGARYYQGDSQLLRLAPEERNTCVQFKHN